MTREKEIKQAASSFTYVIRDCATSRTEEDFIQGAKLADEHLKEGLVEVEKVEQWIKECFAFLNDAGHHNFKVDKFIDNFRKAMEERQ